MQRHLPALDGLRGVAILMVIMTHVQQGWMGALSIYTDPIADTGGLHLPKWLVRVTEAGSHGVQLFFVVSAFTLTLRVGPNGHGLAGYAWRRLARVGPSYWLAGALYLWLGGLGPRFWAPHGIGLVDIAVASVFGTPWQGGAAFAVVPGGWSVCCEVTFYLALPLFAWAVDGDVRRAVYLTTAIYVVAMLRMLLGSGLSVFDPVQEMPVFMCGLTAALVARTWRRPLPSWPVPLLLLTAIVLLPLIGYTPPGQLIFGILFAAATAISAVAPSRMLASRAMTAIGRVSYSMYLVHFAMLAPSMWLAERLIPAADWCTLAAHFAITAAASFALSCLTYRFVEQPCIHWAGRFRQAAPSPVVPA